MATLEESISKIKRAVDTIDEEVGADGRLESSRGASVGSLDVYCQRRWGVPCPEDLAFFLARCNGVRLLEEYNPDEHCLLPSEAIPRHSDEIADWVTASDEPLPVLVFGVTYSGGAVVGMWIDPQLGQPYPIVTFDHETSSGREIGVSAKTLGEALEQYVAEDFNIYSFMGPVDWIDADPDADVRAAAAMAAEVAVTAPALESRPTDHSTEALREMFESYLENVSRLHSWANALTPKLCNAAPERREQRDRLIAAALSYLEAHPDDGRVADDFVGAWLLFPATAAERELETGALRLRRLEIEEQYSPRFRQPTRPVPRESERGKDEEGSPSGLASFLSRWWSRRRKPS